jgi:hypothetical protein
MDSNPFEQIDNLAAEIMSIHKHPLLVMFYYETAARISHEDVRDVYDEFRRRGWTRDAIKDNLDVLIHSYGGNADASYRVGQIIQDFAKTVRFLVPFHATSGATLVCLGGREIRLGAYAALSPIDIRMGDIELASIDSFKQFAVHCRQDLEEILDKNKSTRTTDIESVLLCEMVRQNTALGIGSLYRTSRLTGHYAHRLMYDYMFAGHPNRDALAQNIATQILQMFPSHDFVLDYHMASLLELPVKEMNEEESDKTKSLVNLLDDLVRQGIICRDIGEDEEGETLKSPFFRLYS